MDANKNLLGRCMVKLLSICTINDSYNFCVLFVVGKKSEKIVRQIKTEEKEKKYTYRP